MRSVCVQFQPDRVAQDEALVRKALGEALDAAEFEIGKDGQRYENFIFEAVSPEAALSKARVVSDAAKIGRTAHSECIVTCQGDHGWNDYLLLHHFDRTLT
jgi:hypothetical protein